MEKWIELYESTALIPAGSRMFKRIFNTTNIASHAFNPNFKDLKLPSALKSDLRIFVLKLLKDPAEFDRFDEYLDGGGEFNQEELKGLDVKTYWTAMKGHCPKLSQIALSLCSLPATTNQEHKDSCKIKEIESSLALKIAFIKSTL